MKARLIAPSRNLVLLNCSHNRNLGPIIQMHSMHLQHDFMVYRIDLCRTCDSESYKSQAKKRDPMWVPIKESYSKD